MFIFICFVYFAKKNMFFLCPICKKIVLLAKIYSALKAGSVSQEIKETYFFFEKIRISAEWGQFVKKRMIVLGTCETRKKQLLMP